MAEGAEIALILAGAEAYARFCSATGKLNTEFVLQAATFFLGEERHFEEPWSLPREPARMAASADRPANRATPSHLPFRQHRTTARQEYGEGTTEVPAWAI